MALAPLNGISHFNELPVRKLSLLGCLSALTIVIAPTSASAQIWASWALPAGCSTTSLSGAFGSGTVTFATSGSTAFSGVQDASGSRCGPITENGGGNNFFNPSGPYSPLPSNISFVQINQALAGTVTFSSAVLNPYFALISVGQSGTPVTYDFGLSAFTVVSNNNLGNCAYWGCGSHSVAGNALTGTEFSGTLQFIGTFSSISFTTNPSENWHGFTVGADGPADVVPEPATMTLLATGLAGMAAARKRRKSV